MNGMRHILLAAAIAVLAFGCASGGGSSSSTVFVAPDGAKATPNTGASRLADGGMLGDVSTGAGATAVAASTSRGTTTSADGTVFTWTGGGGAVSLAGDFNNWDQAADPMAKQADGSFRLVKPLAPGRYGYKFVVDGQWKPDPAAKESADDGFGGKNSIVVVGAGGAGAAPAVVAGAAGAAAAAAGGPSVSADGVRFTYAGAAGSVHVAGDWNGWSTSADPMTKNADGTWALVKSLPAGTHAYKFVVDGTNWKTDEANPNTVDDGFGGKNAVVTVGEGGAAAATAGAVAGAAVAGAGKGKAPEVTTDGVRFTFAGTAGSVHLAGDFNGWSTSADPLTRGADGAWTIVKKLPSGTHAYKFIVDGSNWKTDDANPNTVDDGFGGKNAVVTVP